MTGDSLCDYLYAFASLNEKLFGLFLIGALSLVSIVTFSQVPKWKAWEVQGDTLYDRQDYKGAIKFYGKVIDGSKPKGNKFEDKEIYPVVYKRAVCYYNTMEFDKALQDLEAFIPVFPGSPQPILLRAFIYRELGDDDKQLSSLQEAMALEPPNPDLLKWRGLLYLQMNDFKNAKKDALHARELQDDPEVETYLGLAYFNLGQKDSSFVSFSKAMELDATYLPAYLYAGSVSMEDGNYDLSLQYLNLALRLDPKNKEAMFYKGLTLIELKRIDEGCRCLNNAFYSGFDDAADYLKEHCFEVED